MQIEQAGIMVSVCCVTYNHEKYIAEALKGFLMQRTNFQYEVIIGEDCSTDSTREIISDYISSYPGKIHLVTSSENVGSIRNQVRTLRCAKGKYIAMCDGDDYWTDPLKLQKQVDFMEHHPDSVICCHYSRVIDESGKLVYENPTPVKLEFSYEDVLMGQKEETRTCSLMIKNQLHINQLGSHEWYHKTYGADTFFKLYALAKENGKIHVLPEVMSVYRLHRNGIWSLIDSKLRKKRMISDFNIMINHFNYPDKYKKKLLIFYIRQYLLFDIRHYNIQNAFNTIMTLSIIYSAAKMSRTWMRKYFL